MKFRGLTNMRAGAIVATTSLVVAGAAALVAATPASATTGPIAQRASNGVTADALPTVQIDNGVVWTSTVGNGIAYVGGNFSNTRPAGAASGTNLTPRSNIAAINLSTGALVTTFAPSVNGQVKAVALSPDGTRLYVGGAFTTANGVSKSRIAAFSTSNGALITTFAASVNAQVNAITATNSTVYVGGVFSAANGNTRTRLAAFSASTGSLQAWAPTADNDVDALLLTPDQSRVIVAGAFANVNGVQARGSASLDATTGASLPWAINNIAYSYNTSLGGAILSLSTDGTAIYGSAWNYGSPSNFEGVFSVDPSTGNVNWIEDCHGDTYDTFPTNGVVYVVSHEHFCSNVGAFPEVNPRAWHRTTAFTAAATGTLTSNQEGGTGYGDFGGEPSPSQINWYPDLVAGTFTGQTQAAWTVSGNSQYIIEGGEFPTVNGTAQYGLVRFGVPSVSTNKQGPMDASSTVTPTVLVTSNTTDRVTFETNWDRDDENLTYNLYRSDNPNTPIYTTTAISQFWNRPVLSYRDSGLTAGATYQYWVKVNDPSGNLVRTQSVSVTMPTNFVLSQYAQDVMNLNPAHYWRLDEASGTSTGTDFGGTDNLIEGTGVANGAAGAIIGDNDTAATFDGTSNGVAIEQTAEAGPNVFTASAWFNTTTTSGGKILGFGDSSNGTSSNYDRHIYMDNAGHIIFGVYNNGVYTVQSTKTYNDGTWHQVVASLSSTGMVLYIDGKKVGTNGGTAQGQPYTGYWHVGGDNLNGWSSQPSSNDFAGTIDEVAIYSSALTLAQVQQQYTDSGRSLGTVAAPTDTYGKTVYADNPDAYFRMNETSGTTAVDSSSNANNGVYSGGETFGTASPVSGSTGTAVTFNGVDGTLGSAGPISGPTTYTEEAWFKTTTTSGGKIIGFGDQQSGNSSNYDRHVYMNPDGTLTFGVWTGQTNLATSTSSYNEGNWHYVAATQGSDGMSLYVDGKLVATNAQTQAQSYNGYWRVGGDSSWNGSNYFAGTIDEAAFYNTTELTAAQIAAHYKASPASPNTPPVASYTSSCTNLSCTFDGTGSSDPDGTVASYSWNYGDNTATDTGSKPSHTFAAAGTYTVALTVTDNQGATNTSSQQITVTAPANKPPVASYTYTCTNLACTFDGTGSSDPDGTVASYSWNYGDNTATDTGSKPSHTFAAGGTYTVALTVTDNQGATNTTSQQITVAPNSPPTAKFTSSCNVNLVCSFDGTGSSDSDGTIAGYAWAFGDSSSSSAAQPSHTYATAGTYSVTLTVTDNQGATGSVTQQVTVAGQPLYASDAFGRTATNSWGSADTGGAYTLTGTTSRFSVGSGTGNMKLDAAGAGPMAILNSVSATNVNILADSTTDAQGTGSGISLVYLARHTSTGDYRLKVRLLPGGVVHLVLSKVVSGTETVFKEVTITGLTYNTGDVLRTRFVVTGSGTTTLTGKVWNASTTEPTAAQISATDTTASLQTAGSVGIYSYLATNATNAPVNVKYDNLSVTGA